MTFGLFFLLLLFIVLSELWIVIRPPINAIKPRKKLRKILFLLDALFLLSLIALLLSNHPYHDPASYQRFSLWIMAFMLIYSPRWFITFFEILRSIAMIFHWIKTSYWVRLIGLSFASIWFIMVFVGIVWTKNAPVLTETTIVYDRLPSSFDGFRIVQISDLHLGSFRRTGTIERSVEIIKMAKPDIIVLTGDLVNLFPEEADAYISILAKLNSPYGKFAVLGNHDFANSFGSSIDENGSNDISDNVEKKLIQMGFDVLRDRHIIIHKGNDSIAIAGVDNIGLPPFKAHGNLVTAIQGIHPSVFTILLSHDPTHWQSQILPKNAADLTLSGHTHGMQIGWRNLFSFAKIKYNEWSGLYVNDNRILYVNTGLGFIGLPLRIGIRPEISLIVLRKKANP